MAMLVEAVSPAVQKDSFFVSFYNPTNSRCNYTGTQLLVGTNVNSLTDITEFASVLDE
jgi:hypothetical protein